MSTIKMFEYTSKDVEIEVNKGIDLLLFNLYQNRVISKEIYDRLIPYRIILVDKTFLGRLWSRIKNPDDKMLYYRVVKVINKDENND